MKSIKSAAGAFAPLLVALAVVLFAGVADAAPSQIHEAAWTVPTTRVDGTALSPSEIAKYTLTYTVDGGAPQSVDVTGAATKAVTTTLPARRNPYVFLWTVSATDTDGNVSAPSAAVSKSVTVRSAVPGKPVIINIQSRCVDGTCALIIQ